MLDVVIAALEALANAKALLDLTTATSRYVTRKYSSLVTSDEQYNESRRALEVTLEEWRHIAKTVEPQIDSEYRHFSKGTLPERAQALATLAKRYATATNGSADGNLDHIILRHSTVTFTPEGKLQVRFGRSAVTRPLRGDAIEIAEHSRPAIVSRLDVSKSSSGGRMQLPVFKITMLGGSGVGKTVFMSSMYARLRDAQHNIAIRAISNDVDLELDQNMRALYGQNKWPLGTEFDEKKYEFELLLRENPIALIDWVDYRGALLTAAGEEGGSSLIKRLQDSHCVIWMIDMTDVKGAFNSMQARVMTNVGRMAHLSRQAIRGTHNLRSILFVRTKSDQVLGEGGKPNMDKACAQLIEHLGPDNFGDIPASAAIPVSSVGRIVGEKRLLGDDPLNVEWPLILALAFLLETELRKLNRAADVAHREWAEARPGKLLGLFKEILNLGPDERESKATQQLDRLSQHLIGMNEVIKELVRKVPGSVRVLG
jgi:hypothetical protein